MAQNYRLSFRRQWRALRASSSLPALLSYLDEKHVVAMLASVNGGIVIFTLSILAWLTGQPLVFPSLGPTAYVLFTRPFSEAAAPRSVVLSHLGCIGCGLLAWVSVSFVTGHTVSLDQPGLAQCVSANVGFVLAVLLLLRLSLPHPPACATALMIATGAITGWWNLGLMAGGIVVIAFQGFFVYRLLGVRTPAWSIESFRKMQNQQVDYTTQR